MTDTVTPPLFFTMPDGARIAHRLTPPKDRNAPTVVFLPGYMSDMGGSKATMLQQAAKAAGIGRCCSTIRDAGCRPAISPMAR
jgi:cephalosporin-C deacetylase-like acetyl esterase